MKDFTIPPCPCGLDHERVGCPIERALASVERDPVLWASLATMMRDLGQDEQVGGLVDEAFACLARRQVVRNWFSTPTVPEESVMSGSQVMEDRAHDPGADRARDEPPRTGDRDAGLSPRQPRTSPG